MMAEPSLAVALIMLVAALGAYMASFALLHRVGRPPPYRRSPSQGTTPHFRPRIRHRGPSPSPAWPRADTGPAASWENTLC